jgi:hypothetical protein
MTNHLIFQRFAFEPKTAPFRRNKMRGAGRNADA